MEGNFQDHSWRISYRTSSINPEGNPTDILHEFYLPALRLATTYDRMAGYFRSSSLAAASQGFTSFLKRDGQLRLIVGSDLAEQDVEAILQGDEERFSNRLLAELSAPDDWNQDVSDGVSLLSRMVASGQLELRVAFRVNAHTGKPIAMNATDDGYVHEKWFVMGDEDGNHLYGSGSLNESRTALVLNAENIDIHCDWEGGSSEQRVRQAQRDFDALWGNRVAHMSVLPLPEAVRLRLIILAKRVETPREIDGTPPLDAVKPSAMEMLRFAVIKDAPKMPGGQYVGMYSAPVEPWPHQEIVARRLVETWPYSHMLCDEVGLGKTIEAALAIRSLVLSGYANRVLIAAPASLTNQWHRELAQKAMLPFARTVASPQIRHETIYPAERSWIDQDLYSPSLNIISTGLLARKERADALLQAQTYDIALVDESHYARRQNPRDGAFREAKYGKLYLSMQNALRPKTKSLWMATATPMQIDPVEVYDLLRLTDRVGAYQHDPSATIGYFQIMAKLVQGEAISPHEWSFLGASFQQIEATDPYLWGFLQKTCVDSRNRKLLRDLPYPDRAPKKADHKYLPRPMFAASPLSRVMMRHTRDLLNIYRSNGELASNLAKRYVLPIEAVKFTDEERAFYEMLEEYCLELGAQIRQANEQSKQMMFFLLNFLQLRFASSLYAIQQTLKRRLVRVQRTLRLGAQSFENEAELQEYIDQMEDDDKTGVGEEDLSDIRLDMLLKNRSQQDLLWEEVKLKRMLEQLSHITNVPSKIQALLTILEKRRIGGTERIQQTVLFTRFLDSLKNIRHYLSSRNPKMCVGLYSGQLSYYYDPARGKDRSATHEEIKRLFLAGEIDLLLCTDAAAEGLNLQTANMLINFDLGWNPMKIEQRIGRIDRIGQKYSDICVLNMCYLGSAEETVYGRLLERLRKANLIVGTQQISMLPVEPADFRGLEDGSLSEEELAQKAQELLRVQRRANASMEMSAQDQYWMYHKMSEAMQAEKIPARLHDIWAALTHSEYLKDLGGRTNEEDHTWTMPASGLLPSIKGTIDRNSTSETIEFLTWGNHTFDLLLESIASQLPEDCSFIRKIAVDYSGSLEIVAYVVATKEGQRLITSYSDLDGLALDENGSISDDELSRWHIQLRELADTVTMPMRRATKVEKTNQDIARLHYRFMVRITVALLEDASENSGLDLFYKALSYVQENGSRHLSISAEGFHGHESELLFNTSLVGDKMYIPVNDLLLNLAIEMAERAADGIKAKKSEIRTADVVRRLKA